MEIKKMHSPAFVAAVSIATILSAPEMCSAQLLAERAGTYLHIAEDVEVVPRGLPEWAVERFRDSDFREMQLRQPNPDETALIAVFHDVTTTPEEHRDAARSLRVLADSLAGVEPERAADLRFAVARSFLRRDFDVFVDEAESLIQDFPDDFRSIDASRILATQVMLRAGSEPGAFEAAEERLADARRHFYDADSDAQLRSTFDIKNITDHHATMLSILSRHEDAVRARNSILEHEWIPLNADELIRIYTLNAQDLRKAGNTEAAIETLERLLRADERGEIELSPMQAFVARMDIAEYGATRVFSEDHGERILEVLERPEFADSLHARRANALLTAATAFALDQDRAQRILERTRTLAADARRSSEALELTESEIKLLITVHTESLVRLIRAERARAQQTNSESTRLVSLQLELTAIDPSHPLGINDSPTNTASHRTLERDR